MTRPLTSIELPNLNAEVTSAPVGYIPKVDDMLALLYDFMFKARGGQTAIQNLLKWFHRTDMVSTPFSHVGIIDLGAPLVDYSLAFFKSECDEFSPQINSLKGQLPSGHSL